MKRFLFRYVFPGIITVILRLLNFTYRISYIDNTEVRNGKNGIRPIYISWHQRFLAGILPLSREKPIAIIISRSKDGDLASGVVKNLGWTPIRGSSSSGGAAALNRLKNIGENFAIGHIVDGPKGPFGEVKPGLIMLAGITGMPVVPVIISAEKKWEMKSWDKFIVPKPFTKIKINFEKEIYIPRLEKKEDIRVYQEQLKSILFKSYDSIDDSWNK